MDGILQDMLKLAAETCEMAEELLENGGIRALLIRQIHERLEDGSATAKELIQMARLVLRLDGVQPIEGIPKQKRYIRH
jgi:hypothetical protein